MRKGETLKGESETGLGDLGCFQQQPNALRVGANSVSQLECEANGACLTSQTAFGNRVKWKVRAFHVDRIHCAHCFLNVANLPKCCGF